MCHEIILPKGCALVIRGMTHSGFTAQFVLNPHKIIYKFHVIVGLSNMLYRERRKKSSKFLFRREPIERTHR